MEALELPSDRPWPHVGLIDNQGKIGTGFIVRGRYAITAGHILEDETTKVLFVLKDQRFEAEVIYKLKGKDIALLRLLSDDYPLLPPLPLGLLPNLPVAYTTWGYRLVRGYQLLQGFGTVRAWLDDGSLQLETRNQRPGMSGSPVAIGGRGGLRVVAIAVARYYPEVFQDDEPLAFAYSLEPLPPEILQYLGNSKKLHTDESLERAAKGLDALYREKMKSSHRMVKRMNTCAVIIFVVLGVAGLNMIDSLIWLPVMAILVISLVYFGFRSHELKDRAELASTLSGLIRSSDPDIPLQEGFKELLEELK